MPIKRHHIKEICIYTFLTFGGLLVDLGVSTLLVYLLALPLVLSGAFGLLAGAITNYFIHLNVTFKDRNLKPTWKAFFKYLQTCLIGAGIRLMALTFLSLFSGFSSFTSLIIATSISFTVNYLLSRFYVFRPHP